MASNDIKQELSPEQKLNGYKDQNKVEKGFRFLKAPAFLASNIFVKKPERVEATLMLMTLCLLVYAALERELRQVLNQQEETLQNQNKKEVKNPTMKWIFILFRGIHLLYSFPKYYVDLFKKKDYVIIRYPFISSSFFGTQT